MSITLESGTIVPHYVLEPGSFDPDDGKILVEPPVSFKKGNDLKQDRVQPWTTTFTGCRIHYRGAIGVIRIEDIAHALAMKCRFNGHTREFYSVAQHSVLVSRLVMKNVANRQPLLRLRALLHDGSEAYLPDVPKPVKHLPELDTYRELDSRIQTAVFEAFGLGVDAIADIAVKEADIELLYLEARAHMTHLNLRECGFGNALEMRRLDVLWDRYRGAVEYAWSPVKAEKEFLQAFSKYELAGRVAA